MPKAFIRIHNACLYCASPLGRWQQFYCSTSCRAKIVNTTRQTRRDVPKKICPVCNTAETKKSYCSRKCMGIALRKDPALVKERARINNLLKVRRYQARVVGQTPDDADHNAIRMIYAACPPGYEVDHIVPISRDGKHHQDNLQYLPAIENRKKSNKLNYGSVTREAKGADS
jgi:predicted nucleic acid-binding Zn ribbon protein